MSKLIKAGGDTYLVFFDLSVAEFCGCPMNIDCSDRHKGEPEREGYPANEVIAYYRCVNGVPDLDKLTAADMETMEEPDLANGLQPFLPLFAQIGLDCFLVTRFPPVNLLLVKIGNVCSMVCKPPHELTIHFNFWATPASSSSSSSPDGDNFDPTKMSTDDPRVVKVFIEVSASVDEFVVMQCYITGRSKERPCRACAMNNYDPPVVH